MFTRKINDAALFIKPEAAERAAADVTKKYGDITTEVTRKVRRLIDRWNVEHGYCVMVHTIEGSELYLSEAALG